MASSFLIFYPDVPALALNVTSTGLPSASALYFDDDYSLVTSFYGETYNHTRLDSTRLPSGNTGMEVVFDLGTGNSRTIDHLVIGGVKSLLAAGATGAYVQGSNDGSTWTSLIGTTANFQTRTKSGPYSDDIVFTPSFNDQIAGSSAAYRYFKFIISGATANAILAFRKLYFGSAFDIGKEPSTYNMEVLTEDDSDTWKYPRGHIIMSKAFYPKHQFTVEFDGVTDAKVVELMSKILGDPYRNTVYLYAESFQDPLYDNRLIHCRVIADSCSITKDNETLNWNDVILVFEEI
jgi:hypothetical protein